jgi:hypothetical protein
MFRNGMEFSRQNVVRPSIQGLQVNNLVRWSEATQTQIFRITSITGELAKIRLLYASPYFEEKYFDAKLADLTAL